MNDIIKSLKSTITNKNNFTISNNNINKIKSEIEQTKKNPSNLRDFNDINIVLQKYEYDLREISNELRNLKKKIKTRKDSELDIIQNNKCIDKSDDFER